MSEQLSPSTTATATVTHHSVLNPLSYVCAASWSRRATALCNSPTRTRLAWNITQGTNIGSTRTETAGSKVSGSVREGQIIIRIFATHDRARYQSLLSRTRHQTNRFTFTTLRRAGLTRFGNRKDIKGSSGRSRIVISRQGGLDEGNKFGHVNCRSVSVSNTAA